MNKKADRSMARQDLGGREKEGWHWEWGKKQREMYIREVNEP